MNYNKRLHTKLTIRKTLTMDIQAKIRELNEKAKHSKPFDNAGEMSYLKENWNRHSCVREMWNNPDFSHREFFQSWGCWWFLYTSIESDEYLDHKDIYEKMKNFAYSDKSVSNPCFQKLWRTIDDFFALYYLEFPFWAYPNPPEFEFNSVEDFFKSL